MTRRGGKRGGDRTGDLEAFVAFLGGLLAVALLASVLWGIARFIEFTPGPLRLSKALGAALWLTVTVFLYRGRRAVRGGAAGGGAAGGGADQPAVPAGRRP
ncbi:hypothetical protein [Kitasatospora herbaricolor]|uniref:Uncharacterized protein n=1 Tax=Kitasatospora herbaricolor TaxID=68217 RepID=A0ABZ1W913_9ACTN|nr:hypothetical protein [Kitasatospora herbaricolor]